MTDPPQRGSGKSGHASSRRGGPRSSPSNTGNHSNQAQGTNSKKGQSRGAKGGATNHPFQWFTKHPVASYPPSYTSKIFESKKLRESREMSWENPTDWDLLVICREGVWTVHLKVLKEKAPGFHDIVMKISETTQHDGADVLSVDLSDWQPTVIGCLVEFLYMEDWKDVDGYPRSTTNLRSVCHHANMAGQSWTLIFPTTVRQAAVVKINRATYRFNNYMEELSSQPISPIGYFSSIEEPIFRTLEFLYSQEQDEVMKHLLPVRAAVSRLVDVALPWLWKQADFKQRFLTIWAQEPLYSRWAGDHFKFFHVGCLLPSWDDPPSNWDPSILEAHKTKAAVVTTPEKKGSVTQEPAGEDTD